MFLKKIFGVTNLIFLLVQSLSNLSFGQIPLQASASEIELALKKLNVLGNVLYIAAHPDDENTRLITYFTKDKLFNTAYLSLTRGDGGQNLIGSETGELLGVIRTQELLQARNIDGGRQYFSRAKDFGFSKTPDETFEIWDKEKVLADVVWVIRNFKPEVIVTRFSLEPGKTHGHHTASAMLAVEAFEAAADKNRFPEQLKYVDTWQVKRVVWNTNKWFYPNEEALKSKNPLSIDVGEYSTLLGKSFTEIAAESRSMHKSQGFGTSGSRGTALEFIEHLKGPKAEKDIFEDVITSWEKVPNAQNVAKLFQNAIECFSPENPSAIVPTLLKAYKELDNIPSDFWREIKKKEVLNLIKASLGLYLESVASSFTVVPGESLKVNVEVTNRSKVPVELERIQIKPVGKDSVFNHILASNDPLNFSTSIQVPADMPYTTPYWLKEEGTKGMFKVEDQLLIGKPENDPAFKVVYHLKINGQNLEYSTPVIYKRADPVEGEEYRPLEVVPPVFVNLIDKVYVFAEDKPKDVAVKVRAGKNNVKGIIKLNLPGGWRSDPSLHSFSLKNKSEVQDFYFKVYPPKNVSEGVLSISAILGEKEITKGINVIEYKHILPQTLLPDATAKIVRVDLKKKGGLIGYIKGAGDEVPASLAQIGYKVEQLDEKDFLLSKLKKYDAIIAGIRAYNTNEALRFGNDILLEYVKNGGTLIVQYNTTGGFTLDSRLLLDSIGPFPIKISRDRVTDESSTVSFLKPDHPVLCFPNKISSKDFEGWVQERGLYFPNEWSKEYDAILSLNDKGESPKGGGVLIAKYGKGHYVYTGLSWFRQLPAGVPGAYRLFTNLISLGK